MNGFERDAVNNRNKFRNARFNARVYAGIALTALGVDTLLLSYDDALFWPVVIVGATASGASLWYASTAADIAMTRRAVAGIRKCFSPVGRILYFQEWDRRDEGND